MVSFSCGSHFRFVPIAQDLCGRNSPIPCSNERSDVHPRPIPHEKTPRTLQKGNSTLFCKTKRHGLRICTNWRCRTQKCFRRLYFVTMIGEESGTSFYSMGEVDLILRSSQRQQCDIDNDNDITFVTVISVFSGLPL